MKTKPFIHLFKTSIGNYLYDVNTDAILKISRNLYNYLDNLDEFADIDENLKEEIELLEGNGFLKGKPNRIVKHPATDYINEYLENRVSSIVLQVTQNCNMKCSYCVYSGGYKNRTHNNSNMTFDMAKKGIDFLIEHSSDLEELLIAFYGGEPLLNFKLIKQCVEYIKEETLGRTVHFNMTTNLTLLTSEIAEFLYENKFSILISMDGPEEIHDKNRVFANGEKGAHKKVIENIKYIKDTYPDWISKIQVNVVVDQREDFKTVNEYFKTEKLFSDIDILYSFISNNNVKNRVITSEDCKMNEEYEYFKMLLYKIEKISKDSVSPLLRADNLLIGQNRVGKQRTRRNEIPLCTHHGGPCIPGTRSLFMNVNGDFYPCEKVSEEYDFNCIGNIYKGFDYEKIYNMLNLENITSEECKNCWAYDYCSVCIVRADTKKDSNLIDKSSIINMCPNIRKSVEDEFKDYVFLRELGYDFETDNLEKLK